MIAAFVFAALVSMPKCQPDTVRIVQAWNQFSPMARYLNGEGPGVIGHTDRNHFGWKWSLRGGQPVDGSISPDGKRVVMTDCNNAYSTNEYEGFFPGYRDGSGCTIGYGLGGQAYVRFAVRINEAGAIVAVYEGLGNTQTARGLCSLSTQGRNKWSNLSEKELERQIFAP